MMIVSSVNFTPKDVNNKNLRTSKHHKKSNNFNEPLQLVIFTCGLPSAHLFGVDALHDLNCNPCDEYHIMSIKVNFHETYIHPFGP